MAAALGRPVVVDVDAGMMAVALPAEVRRQALEDLDAPAFELPDLRRNPPRLDEWHGQKKLLVTFASWCGCRYDLPGWQALHDELAPEGFTVIAVAIDHCADDVRPWTEGITMPVLYDPHHLLTELYAISNVPTVVWIDEDDHIVRPNGVAFGTDLFADFTGVRAGPHLDEVRRWVNDGSVPLTEDEARRAVDDLSETRCWPDCTSGWRPRPTGRGRGHHPPPRRRGLGAGPDDLTIWRAAMPLVGEDPFGDDFLARYEEWRQKGSPPTGWPRWPRPSRRPDPYRSSLTVTISKGRRSRWMRSPSDSTGASSRSNRSVRVARPTGQGARMGTGPRPPQAS